MGFDNNRLYIEHIILDFIMLMSLEMAVAIDDSTTILLHEGDDHAKITKKIRKSNFIINT